MAGATTSMKGTHSITECSCMRGFYASAETIEPTCNTCPEGAECPGGSTIITKENFWAPFPWPSSLPSRLPSCILPKACAGGANSSCYEGYTGCYCTHHPRHIVDAMRLDSALPMAGPICGYCAAHYKLESDKCVFCEDGGSLILPIILCSLLGIITVLWYCYQYRIKMRLLNEPLPKEKDDHSARLRIQDEIEEARKESLVADTAQLFTVIARTSNNDSVISAEDIKHSLEHWRTKRELDSIGSQDPLHRTAHTEWRRMKRYIGHLGSKHPALQEHDAVVDEFFKELERAGQKSDCSMNLGASS